MANRYAVANGNWSATATWDGGTLPTSADDVYANGFTVTINQNATVLSVRTTSAAGINAGGGFSVSATGYTLTLTGTGVVAGTTACITSTVGVGSSFAVSAGTANIQAGSAGTAHGISHNGAGTLNVTGRPTGGGASGAQGVNNALTGTVNITGDVTGSSSAAAAGAGNPSTGTISITGNVSGGAFSANASGVTNSIAGTVTITGNLTGGSLGDAVRNSGAGTITVTGNATGGGAATAYAANNVGVGTITITGIATASAQGNACINASSGVLRVTRAVGNGHGLGSVSTANVVAIVSSTNNSLTYIQELEFGSLGQSAVSGPILLTDQTTNVASFYKEGGGRKTLVDQAATAGVLPAVGDVRTGTVYAAGNRTGTCAVPAAGSVALGVAVDNTTGTAVLTAANVRTAVGLASANLDAQFAAIPAAPSAAAIRTEMDSNSTKLANLDATVSSRLPSSSYQAPLDAAGTRSAVGLASSNLDTQLSGISSGVSGLPSAAAIASAVWSAATRTLTTAIDNSATIAAAVWNSLTSSYNTNGTFGKQVLIGSTSQREVAVTGSHHVAADIHELQPAVIESSHFAAGALDGVRTSIGLASANLDTQLDAIPTAAENATANRSELAPELARVSNAATTQEVADIVEGATSG